MLTRNRRRREQLNPTAEINLVNLVDLAFVLLIIFMITAPMLQGGIEVTLPRAVAAPMSADQGVIVSIDRSGRIFLGAVPVQSAEDLAATLPSYLRAKGTREVYLKGDGDVTYRRVLEVFSILKKLDVAEVSLIVEPEVERR